MATPSGDLPQRRFRQTLHTPLSGTLSAFGRAGASAAHVALPQVAPGFSARELAAIAAAKPGSLIQQQSSSGIEDKVTGSDAVGTRGGWLWALLVGGVLALAAMAWHLFRQLKSGVSEPPPA